MRRIRVAHVITRLCKGGAQENTLDTVRLANRDRFDVDLICGFVPETEQSIETRARRLGISIIRAPELKRDVAPYDDIRALRRLARLFREKEYDIVHTHTSKAGFLGRVAAARAKVPVVVHTSHGNIFDGYFGPLTTRLFVALEQYAAKRCARMIELTPNGVAQHLAQGIGRREQYEVIFSGVDFAPFSAALERREEMRRTLGAQNEDVLVGGVGRLEPVKGFEYFVRMAAQVARSVAETRFLIAGDGSQRERLEGLAAELGAPVTFLGAREDIPEIMAAMDIFVLPSLNEGMGRVLLEAGAARNAIVASDVGGVRDVLEDGRLGVLTPARDVDALAEAVRALVKDPARRAALGEAAERAVVPGYSVEEMVKRIEALYETLIEEAGLDT